MNKNYSIIDNITDKHWQQEFMRLPWRLYQNDPGWIPSLTANPEEWFGPSHPVLDFIQFKHFLIVNENRTIGRATAFLNSHCKINGKPLGSIGFFECENDNTAASLLLEKACHWLADTGASEVWAPMDGTIYQSHRCMTSGFEDLPYCKEPFNKPYYADLFKSRNFTSMKRWYSDTITDQGITQLLERYQPAFQRSIAAGYQFRKFDSQNMDRDIILFLKMLGNSYSGFTGFHPLAPDKLKAMLSGMKQILYPDFCYLAFDPRNEPCGFYITFPEIHTRDKDGRLQLEPFQHKNTDLKNSRIARFICLYLGLTRKEISRHSEAGRGLGYFFLNETRNYQCPKIYALIAEDSPARFYLKYCTGKRHEYALFGRNLESTTNSIESYGK